MGSTLLSATMVIADIVFFAIIALFLIIGSIRGVSKTFKGFFMVVAITLIALCLMGITTEPAMKIGFVQSMDSKIETKLANGGQAFSSEIQKGEDGTFYLVEDGSKLSDCDGIKGKLANFIAEKFLTDAKTGDVFSLAGYASNMITTIVVAIVLLIIFSIALRILVAILRKATSNMHTSENIAVKVIDKVLGAIISAALALIFILVVLAILKSINISSVNDFMQGSKICSYFYSTTTNPISQVFAKVFGA